MIVHVAAADRTRPVGRRGLPDAARARSGVLAGPAHAGGAACPARARRGDRRPRHGRSARARPPGRTRVARGVRWRDRRAVGEPLRPGEPDDRRRRARRPRRTTSTSCSTAARASSGWSRRSSTARAPSRSSSASVACRTRASRRSSATTCRSRSDGEVAAPRHVRIPLRARRHGRDRRGRRARVRVRGRARRGSAGRRARGGHSRRRRRAACSCSARPRTPTVRATLYGRLREADARGVDVVLAVPPAEDGRRGCRRPAPARRRRTGRSGATAAARTPRPPDRRVRLGLGGLTGARARSSTCCPTRSSSTSATPAGSRTGPSRPTRC